MIDLSTDGRWPPAYDKEALERDITDLVGRDDIQRVFYAPALRDEPAICQGDIVSLRCEVPIIDDHGRAAILEPQDHWMVIGNTCDFTRDMKSVEWTQMVPLRNLGSSEHLGKSKLSNLRSYRASKGFYIPPWPEGDDDHRLADFLMPVTVHKGAFESAAVRMARFSRPAWVLLHCCLVRFLARDDGRHDPD